MWELPATSAPVLTSACPPRHPGSAMQKMPWRRSIERSFQLRAPHAGLANRSLNRRACSPLAATNGTAQTRIARERIAEQDFLPLLFGQCLRDMG